MRTKTDEETTTKSEEEEKGLESWQECLTNKTNWFLDKPEPAGKPHVCGPAT